MSTAATAAAGAATGTRPAGPDTQAVIAKLIRFLETGAVPDGLFSPSIFSDLSLPHWRIQTATAEAIVGIRLQEHHEAGLVKVERIEQTGHGFTIEFEERWVHEGQHWYCREMIRADVEDDGIAEMSIYCTGDWDEAKQSEHARAVQLIRP